MEREYSSWDSGCPEYNLGVLWLLPPLLCRHCLNKVAPSPRFLPVASSEPFIRFPQGYPLWSSLILNLIPLNVFDLWMALQPWAFPVCAPWSQSPNLSSYIIPQNTLNLTRHRVNCRLDSKFIGEGIYSTADIHPDNSQDTQ